MTNNLQYEERLGTAPMVPLVFRMALPAVVAQLVNLLYNLVDRIYIGHIYGIGVVLLLAFSILCTLSVYIFMEPILYAVGASDVTIGYASDYMSVYLLGTVFVQLMKVKDGGDKVDFYYKSPDGKRIVEFLMLADSDEETVVIQFESDSLTFDDVAGLAATMAQGD